MIASEVEEIDQADLDEPEEREIQDDLDTVLHVAALKERPRRTPPRVMTEAQEEALIAAVMGLPLDHERPRTRADCVDGERPCPYAGCRHHLAIEVHPNTGTIKLAFPDLEIDEMPETCSLDVADRGAHPLDVIGALMNVSHEDARHHEVKALVRLERSDVLRALAKP